MTDISLIITAHREGLLAGVTLQNAREAAARAEAAGLTTEMVVVMDNADERTAAIVRQGVPDGAQLVETALGDPGLARNAGIARAQGHFSAFLDGDDLWSSNWLTEAASMARARPGVIWHSHCNFVFGDLRKLWWHLDSEAEGFPGFYLHWANFWDAMSFAETDIYRRIPFRANDLKNGYGHEDWHWNVVTLRAGIPHKPVPETIHFKRRRAGSQMSKADSSDSVIWPD